MKTAFKKCWRLFNIVPAFSNSTNTASYLSALRYPAVETFPEHGLPSLQSLNQSPCKSWLFPLPPLLLFLLLWHLHHVIILSYTLTSTLHFSVLSPPPEQSSGSSFPPPCLFWYTHKALLNSPVYPLHHSRNYKKSSLSRPPDIASYLLCKDSERSTLHIPVQRDQTYR